MVNVGVTVLYTCWRLFVPCLVKPWFLRCHVPFMQQFRQKWPKYRHIAWDIYLKEFIEEED